LNCRILILLAVLVATAGRGKTVDYEPDWGEGCFILTPDEAEIPRINGPSVFGVRPGAPFHFTVAATGRRPLVFHAERLPDGLRMDADSGIISGRITNRSRRKHRVQLRVENAAGAAEESLIITVGDTLCLTPPMGWVCRAAADFPLNQRAVLAAAEAMAESGLRNHGWNYIIIDDGWQGQRGGRYNAVQADEEKFPSMEKLCGDIHAMGLKVGLYSSPWITTYGGYPGISSDHREGSWDPSMGYEASGSVRKSYQRIGPHAWEEQDAAQWAEWGIDFLRYDWYRNEPGSTERMADALRKCGRDIAYALSNNANVRYARLYGRLANCWRTGGDLLDTWELEGRQQTLRQRWMQHQAWLARGYRGGPGHVPDAGMLMIGNLRTGSGSDQPRPSRLTPDEQYSHVTLWALWCSPLFIECPAGPMDEFTLKLLTNAEVVDVHQDAASIPARTVSRKANHEILVRDLADKSKAIGLFNLGSTSRIIELNWTEAGLKDEHQLRDVWRQRDIGLYKDTFTARVPAHGVLLLRAAPVKTSALGNGYGVHVLPGN
jgi:alpha-galactosidase